MVDDERVTAQTVDLRVSAHELLCAERWTQIRNHLNQLGHSVAGLYKIAWISAGTLIVGMGGLIVTFILRGLK